MQCSAPSLHHLACLSSQSGFQNDEDGGVLCGSPGCDGGRRSVR